MQPGPAAEGVQLVAEYFTESGTPYPAGTAYTHQTMGYQTVNLGFGMEFMMDAPQATLPDGYFGSGVYDRVDLMGNIMEYFGKEAAGAGTGVADPELFATGLGRAYPNPFNPATTIEYSVAAEGRVTLRVYDLTGRVVRTLVDEPVDAGRHAVTWDGVTDGGERAASGVYFVRMETRAFSSARKLVLLK